MVNGFFIMQVVQLPISQFFKLILITLFLFRLLKTKDVVYVALIFLAFQIAPLVGFIKTKDILFYFEDVVAATKWFTVPLSFFYFKNLFQGLHLKEVEKSIRNVVTRSTLFITINMVLGALGFGMAFYFHGYGNSVGTRGFIYAGNELSILVLALGFIISCYYKYREKYFNYFVFLIVFLVFSYLITSKTVLAGVFFVFLIPWLTTIKKTFQKKWLYRITTFLIIGIPFIAYMAYVGISESGVLKKAEYSMKMSRNDFLTFLLSNRNNFLIENWAVYKDYSWFEKITGLGQNHLLNLADKSPELDFFTLLFASGLLGLLTLLMLLVYWLINAIHFSKSKKHIFAKQTFVFLLFLIVTANTAGHVFTSGVAGFYLGFAIALMYYKTSKAIDFS